MLVPSLTFATEQPESTAPAIPDENKITIVIDPGHGGRGSTGTYSYSGKYYERTYTLKLAEKLIPMLEESGLFNVYTTRTDDSNVSLPARAFIADEVNADIVVSLHFDGNDSPSVHGSSVIISRHDKYALEDLGEMVLDELNKSLGFKKDKVWSRGDSGGDYLLYWDSELNWDTHGVRTSDGLADYYGLIRWSAKLGIPSMIIEHCYLTNKKECAIADTDEGLEKIARADADALIEYFSNHEHTYTEQKMVDYPTSCIFRGKESYKCTICKERKDTSYISDAPNDTHNHYKVSSKKATCGSDGYVKYECYYAESLLTNEYEVKGDHSYTETIEAKDHKYKVYKQTAASHGKDGSITYKCSVCGNKYTETVKGEPHEYELIEHIEGNCTQDEIHTYKCKICNDTYSQTMTVQSGHDYTSFVSPDATCTKKGSVIKYCKRCGKSTVSEGSVSGHSYVLVSHTEPTCSTNGYITYVCSVCDNEYHQIIEAYGHKFDLISETEPSCSETGLKTYKCYRCNATKEETVDKLAHDNLLVSHTDASCTSPGIDHFKCSVCNELTDVQTDEMLEHSYTETERTEAKCESEGFIRYSCSVCSHEKTEVINALGHKWEDEGEFVSKDGAQYLVYECENDPLHKKEVLIPITTPHATAAPATTVPITEPIPVTTGDTGNVSKENYTKLLITVCILSVALIAMVTTLITVFVRKGQRKEGSE